MLPNSILTKFAPPKQTLGWAQDAIRELSEFLPGFFSSGDIGVTVTQFDPQTGENVLKLRITKPLPAEVTRKITEALGNIRNAFDQATFAAHNIVSGKGNAKVYYPWSQDPTDLNHRLLKIDKRLWDTLKAHEPYGRSDSYPGGDDLIRALATIANKKHTVGLRIGGKALQIHSPQFDPGVQIHSIRFALIVPWDTEKNETELIRWKGSGNMNGKYNIGFDVFLEDPILMQSVGAVSALDYFATKAHMVIEALQARCLELSI